MKEEAANYGAAINHRSTAAWPELESQGKPTDYLRYFNPAGYPVRLSSVLDTDDVLKNAGRNF
jgi:hypothetical protein